MADDEYWVIKIPKPRKALKTLARALYVFGGVFSKTFTVDTPFILFTGMLIAFVLFLSFTIVFRIPDIVAALFTAALLALYFAVLRREMRR